MSDATPGGRVPVVDYLVLDPEPRLMAHRCTSCGARYLGRRNGCGRCGGRDFDRIGLATEGEVVACTIVGRSAPGVAVPFAAAVVELTDGMRVSANLVGPAPSPAWVRTGLRVRLVEVPGLGTDGAGTEAVGFGFAPRDAAPREVAPLDGQRAESGGGGILEGLAAPEQLLGEAG